MASSDWAEFLLQTEMKGAMSNIAAARKQLYSKKVRRQEDADFVLSQQLGWLLNECNYYLLLQNTFSDREKSLHSQLEEFQLGQCSCQHGQ